LAMGVYPPRIVVGDQAGEAYVYMGSGSSLWICKLKTDLSNCNAGGNYDCCLGGWHEQADYLYSQSNTYTNMDPFDPEVPNGAQHTYMRTSTGFSLALSHNNPGVLYYCFNTDESNADGPDNDGAEEKDVLCTRGVVNQLGQWTWMAPVNPTGVSNDDTDQFMPEVFVTADDELGATDETVFVHWYDRRGPANNKYFGWYGTVSLDGGLSYQPHLEFYGTGGDPLYLPRHCWDPVDIRFIGDYSAVRPSLLHGHGWYTAVPSGVSVPAGEARQYFRSLGAWFK